MPYKNPEDKKAWRARNKDRNAAYTEAWKHRNPDKVRAHAEKQKENQRLKSQRRRAERSAKQNQSILIANVRMAINKVRDQIALREYRLSRGWCLRCASGWTHPYHSNKARLCRSCNAKESERYRKSERGRLARRNYYHQRKAVDLGFIVTKRLRCRISKAIRRHAQGYCKSGSNLRYLGCSGVSAVRYIESQFKRGMTWDNYGKRWHIDHVIPVSAFDLTTDAGRAKAFHYTNIQPLWAEDNLRKNDDVPTKPHQPMLLLSP